MRSLIRSSRDRFESTPPARATHPVRLRVGFVLALAWTLCCAGAGYAQTVDPNLWITDHQVNAVVRDGNTIYLGGYFTRVGPATGGGVPLDGTTGALPPSFPRVAGSVMAVVSDGAGGWYIGGFFTGVGGFARNNLAHIRSDLSVSGWDPNANGIVYSLAVSGATVYAGGVFTMVGGQVRNRIAAIDAASGATTSWNANANGGVYALLVNGPRVIAGGDFTTIAGQFRNRIAAMDTATGSPTAWNPSISGAIVYALALRDSTLYVGGNFTSISGSPRNNIAALRTTSPLVLGWNADANQAVRTLMVSGAILYVGGDFTSIGGVARSYLAAVDCVLGFVTTWHPTPNTFVTTMTMRAGLLYAGGYFTSVGSQPRGYLAAIDTSSGAPTSWNPNANHQVLALAASGSTVFAGGAFASLGGQVRNRIAALDATTGLPTAWSPNAAGFNVSTIVVRGSTVYAGGDFSVIGGQSRRSLAALDATTGFATSWNPNLNGVVSALAIRGSALYAGGAFDSAGGQSRNNIAALDVATGEATAWIANANGSVQALAFKDSILFAGGSFTAIGGQARSRIAALDGIGDATPWNEPASGPVMALAVRDTILYAGGNFSSIGGVARLGLAALGTSGGVTAWNATSNGLVRALAVGGSTLYAGGDFTSIGGQPHRFLAALNTTTAGAAAWSADADLTVRVLTVAGNSVYAGGDFNRIAVQPSGRIAAITAVPDIQSVQPASGGNSAAVTVTIAGHQIRSGASARLMRSGRPTITGSGIVVGADGLSLTATFNLTGAPTGAWDLVVVNPDAQSATLPSGFTITTVAAPQLRVDVLGPDLIRSNRRTAFDLVIENPGNVDALAVPLWISGVPLGATVELDFALAAPPQVGGEPDWNLVPLAFTSPGGQYVPVVIPRIPPGTTVRRVYLTIPSGVPTFQLRAALTPPWVDGNQFRACLSAGGVISAPACLGIQLTAINAFLASNPQLQALSGIGVWAKIAWQCEGANSGLPAALVKAEQILDFMVQPIEVPGSAIAACSDVLPPRWRDSLLVTIVGSIDPNDKLGVRDSLSLHQAIPYSIRFENRSIATAPAQQVVISDPLDLTKFDASTVSLDVITFGNVHIVPPPGLKSYATQVDLRPARNLLVNVSAGLDPFTGVLTWYFSSIDPATGQPPTNPLSGFLPPNHVPPEGEGSVLFTVMPRSTLVSGTQISNAASITFDGNAPQNTGAWLNTIDSASPGSFVLPLAPSSDLPSVPVQWTATGAPPDLRDYTVYVSEDGAPYRVWRLNTTAVNDTLVPPGNHMTHTYAFYSVARDIHGNIEPAPGAADANTQTTTAVGDGEPLQLALAGARPNPARGSLSVWFTLPSREPATLEVVDIAGRRVLRREVGSLGPGSHNVTLATAPALRPGLYFLRLIQGSRSLSSRVVVIR